MDWIMDCDIWTEFWTDAELYNPLLISYLSSEVLLLSVNIDIMYFN